MFVWIIQTAKISSINVFGITHTAARPCQQYIFFGLNRYQNWNSLKKIPMNHMIHWLWVFLLTWSSESTVSGMISGFFSSLSFPSSSRLPTLLSLGPGEPSPVVVPCDNSFRLKRFLRLPPHGNRNTTIMANAPITRAADKPITTESIGVNAIGARGRSVNM